MTQDAPDDAPVVAFSSVGLRYGRANEVLKDLSFELAPGSFHFLTGAAGAGKTSLLRLLPLALKPSRGLISLFGRDVARLKPYQIAIGGIGYVPQGRRLFASLSVQEHLLLAARPGNGTKLFREVGGRVVVIGAFPGVELQQTYGLSEVGVLRSQSRPDGSLWVRVGGEGFETEVRDGILWIRHDNPGESRPWGARDSVGRNFWPERGVFRLRQRQVSPLFSPVFSDRSRFHGRYEGCRRYSTGFHRYRIRPR